MGFEGGLGVGIDFVGDLEADTEFEGSWSRYRFQRGPWSRYVSKVIPKESDQISLSQPRITP